MRRRRRRASGSSGGVSCVAHRASRGVVESNRRRSGSAQNRRGVRDGGRMVVGGWSSADSHRRMVIGDLARRSSRFGTDASPRDVGIHARETLGETRGDANGATRSVAGTFPRRERRGLDRRRLVALVVVLVRLRSLVARLVVDTSTLLQGVGGEAKSHDVRSVVDEARGALDGDADASRASGCADGGLDEGGVRGARVETPSGSVGGPTGERTALRPVRENHGVPGRRHQIPRRARISRRALYALRSSRPRPNLSTITPARARVDGSPPTPLGDVESRARRSAFHPSRVVSPENFEKFPNDDSSSTERK